MPHKHTRKGNGAGGANVDLPPTSIARPLPAYEKTEKVQKGTKGAKGAKGGGKPDAIRKQKTKARKPVTISGYGQDDTPRAFARMMQAQGGKRFSGLDDGNEKRSNKKRKLNQDDVPEPKSAPAKPDLPKILPGESLADYAARVDQALPVSGLARKGKQHIEGMKERQTKTEKRLKKMYAEWREEEARIKEKEEERRELEEEAEEEKAAKYGGQDINLPVESRKRKKLIGEDTAGDDDPWAVLKERRERPKGLHDVVQAPPTFKVVPKERFKVREGAKVNVTDVPGKAGSLKRREELGEARREVIERYREMMRGKGGI